MNEINVFFDSMFLGILEIEDNTPSEEISKIAQDLLPKSALIKKEVYIQNKFVRFSS